jgi:hypothetical protein
MKPQLKDYKENLIIAEDKITTFSGKVVGHADYITGCDQYLIQPDAKDGAHVEGRWIDEGRLLVVKVLDPINVKAKQNGSDIPAPTK